MSFVTTEVQGAVAIVTIDRPKALNALNPEVLADLKAAFEAIDQNTVRCVVLTGAGDKSFVAGADIGSMSTMTKAEGEAFGKLGNDVFLEIESFPLPVIAAVNGFALGGGNELAMSCDIRICSANAKFGLPEINIGMIPGWGGTLRLARLIGESRAKNMLLRGKMITAQQAMDYGLIAEVYDDVDTMRAKAEELAQELAAKAPITMKFDKHLVYDAAGKQPTDIAQRDANTLGFLFTTHDAKEGLTAFLEKRAPKYEGR